MINIFEDIVNVWLQEVCNHFTRSNIVVRKETRIINEKKHGGGRGKEIDFLSTDGQKYYWVEVSVSLSPFLPSKTIYNKKILDDAKMKFSIEKQTYIHSHICHKDIVKWFIYSPKLFNKRTDEEAYCDALKKENIEAISFEWVLKEICNKLNYFGYDAPRQYLYLLRLLRDPNRTLSPLR